LFIKNQGYVQSSVSKLLQRSTSIDTQHVQVVYKQPDKLQKYLYTELSSHFHENISWFGLVSL
jgi:hypothetical protein